MTKALAALLVMLGLVPAARARPLHGSIGAGGSLLATGDLGDRTRAELELDLEPGSRFGGLVALRAFDHDHHGLVCAGLVYEAGAARPALVVDFHADLGADLDQRAPLAGGGVRTLLGLYGPLALALDTGGYLVIDGVDRTRLVLSLGAGLAARW
jgi:hypothetical protein